MEFTLALEFTFSSQLTNLPIVNTLNPYKNITLSSAPYAFHSYIKATTFTTTVNELLLQL